MHDREGYPRGVRPCDLQRGAIVARPYRDAKTGKAIVLSVEDHGGYVRFAWQRLTPKGKLTGPVEQGSYSAQNMPTVYGRHPLPPADHADDGPDHPARVAGIA